MHKEGFKKCTMPHMLKHYARAMLDNGDYIKFTNENIDTSRTHLNYNLGPPHEDDYQFMLQRISEVKCLKRADVNVAVDWVITAPKGW